MVSYKNILKSNAQINNATSPRVAVFVGGTSGIGQLTIKALVATGACMRIYLIGRESSRQRSEAFIESLKITNEKAEIVWLEAEISFLADAARVCNDIISKESHIDLLFLTTGYAPFGARKETTEGIEICQSLAYYTRMLFTIKLLPLLNKAENPRVISVLAGGLEKTNIDTNDLDLKGSGKFSSVSSQTVNATMNSVTLDKLATENPHITFIHSWPGWVNTGNSKRGMDSTTSWFMSWFVWLIIDPAVRTFGFSDEASAQRHLFLSTSALFGGRGVSWDGKPGLNSMESSGNGLFLVSFLCNTTPNAKNMRILRENSQKAIWQRTEEVLRAYL